MSRRIICWTPLLGTTLASVLFAVALLASGQSSTLTGTYAGQIVMEGFLNLRLRPWLRGSLTRTLAIIPAALTIYILGDRGTFGLLMLSQVILSMQLPFAVIPLIRFTSDVRRMGEFANPIWVKISAWACAAIIVALNFWLVSEAALPWVLATPWRIATIGPIVLGIVALLGYVTFAKPRAAGLPVAEEMSAQRVIADLDRAGLPQSSGSTGPLRQGPRGPGTRRRRGQGTQSLPPFAPCRGRRHQPPVRTHGVGCGSGGGKAILRRHCHGAQRAGD